MSEFPESTSSKKSFSIGRILPFVVVLVAVGGLIYWFVKPKPDIRYVRAATVVTNKSETGAKVEMKLERGAEVIVFLDKELSGMALIGIGESQGAFIPLSEIDKDRRPVLTGAYKAKALQKAISLREEPNPSTVQVDEIPAKTMVQVWGYTATPTGDWAEITRYKEKTVGYVRRDQLEAAFE